MKKHFAYITILFAFLSVRSAAQIIIDHNIEMTNGQDTGRQIRGLAYPVDSSDAVNVAAIQNGGLMYSASTGINDLSVNLLPALNSYQVGLKINLQPQSVNTGPVTLEVNGLGPVPVTIKNNFLKGGELKAGQIVTALYNGSSFEIISRTDYDCPAGFVAVNENYCIESNERAAELYYGAVNVCYSMDARLCSWGEWYYACQNASLGLLNMTNNWEYTEDTSNHTHTAFIVGLGSCIENTTNGGIPGNAVKYTYRCCFSK